jgi:hypothetical protein
MKNTIIEDRSGRKYELHPGVLTERATRWGREWFAILRGELKLALVEKRPLHVLTPTGRTSVYSLNVFRNGRVKIGCRLFLSKAGRELVRWAS